MGFSVLGIQFEQPLFLILIIPVLAILVFIIRKNFIKRLKRAEIKKGLAKKRLLILTSRSLIFACLMIAMASPFSLEVVVKQGLSTVTVLSDNSTSMEVFDLSKIPSVYENLRRQTPVEIRTFASGNLSPIGDAAIAALAPNSNLLLVTDGNRNYGRSIGDALISSKTSNSTINAINLRESISDTSVKIEGRRLTTDAKETELEVIVNQIGEEEPYELKVFINDEPVLNKEDSGSKVFSIGKKFEEGTHSVKAQILIEDHFKQNNEFSKSIRVEQKPKVLLVSPKKTPLSQILNDLYSTTQVSSMATEDLNKYSAVVLNDVLERDIDSEKLKQYVTDGNGLIVFGGKNSYDRGNYEGSEFESILPVRIGRGSRTEDTETNVLLLIDISGSTKSNFKRGSQFEVSEVEKALALSVLRDLKDEDNVAVVAFNTDSFLVHNLSKVGGNRFEIQGKISKLIYYAGTVMSQGIKSSRRILGPLRGSKSIIIFSDGRSGSNYEDLKQAAETARLGIRIYTIGVGEDTQRDHMIKIAKEGNGVYLEPEETERLRIIFGNAEEGLSEERTIEVINNYHFITYNSNPEGSVNGFNNVVPKPNAELLVATKDNNPLITASRLGLGRIAAVSTDDGSAWASQLLTSKNSALISRSINWVIGDLSRNKRFYVDVEDGFEDRPLEIKVISDSEPEHESLSFSKIGKQLYSASFTPNETGKQEFFDTFAFANYPEEYASLGMNPEFKNAVLASGGNFFNPEEVNLLIEVIEEESKIVASDPKNYAWIFLAAALILFLIDLMLRTFMR